MALRLIPPPQTAADVASIERDVITRAIEDMARWIEDLPTESELRWAFLRGRQVLVDELENRDG